MPEPALNAASSQGPIPLAASPRPVLRFWNQQHSRQVDLQALRSLTCWLLQERFQAGRIELCFHLVDARTITLLNEAYLRHTGSTDIITFDYQDLVEARSPGRDRPRGPRRRQTDPPEDPAVAGASFCGEIFISIDDAVRQARRYRVSCQTELARYVIHGLLHLAGYDDLAPAARRRMKWEEDRLLGLAARRFRLEHLAKPARGRRVSFLRARLKKGAPAGRGSRRAQAAVTKPRFQVARQEPRPTESGIFKQFVRRVAAPPSAGSQVTKE